MNEETPTLSADKRERLGSRYSRRLRDAGQLPAIVYGHGETPEPIVLDAKDTMTHISGGERIFDIELGGEKQTVMLKDLQYDYLGTNVVHADFARVDLTERVNVKVRVNLIGDAVGLKATGAILMQPTNELEIECQVSNMPDNLDVDISELDTGAAVYAKDVTLPLPTMVLLSDPETMLAQVVIQQEEVTDEAGEVTAEGAAEPEVLTEKKDDDEESTED
jgi:large subunit ribosomal protein L25